MVILTEKFRFIRDDVFLCPWVDSETGKQKLVMQKINLETNEVEFEDSIDCIHTAVKDITLEEHTRFQSNPEAREELLKETLFIRSSDSIKEIHLSPVEKFKALKSWTAGIAEAGKDALSIQSRIDSALGIWFQISSRLLSFMAKIDSDYIYEILRKVEKECRFEGEYHKSSMFANLLPILWSIAIKSENIRELEPEDKKILSAILDLDPSHEIFYSNVRIFKLLAENFPEIIISELKSEKTSKLKVKSLENIMKLIDDDDDDDDGEYFLQDFMDNIKKNFEAGKINNEEYLQILRDLLNLVYEGGFTSSGLIPMSESILLGSIMNIDPPFSLFRNKPDYIDLLIIWSPSFIPEFLKTINTEVTKDGVRDDKLFLELIDPIVSYTFYGQFSPYYKELDDNTNKIRKVIFELNPPIEFYENLRTYPHPLKELIQSDYIEDLSKQKILKKLLKKSKKGVIILIKNVYEDFEDEFNRILNL